ncbi:MAG TPA: hypothetical protein VMV19_15520 [Xanthobacteraceae bacterium]|nr:hypothetical protein [Xanthobacteraceae bacterium]
MLNDNDDNVVVGSTVIPTAIIMIAGNTRGSGMMKVTMFRP